LALGLTTASVYYINTKDDEENKNENLMYILGATIISFMLAEPDSDLIDYVKEYILGLSTINGGSLSSSSSLSLSSSSSIIKAIKAIITTLDATALSSYFLIDPKLSLSKNMKNLWKARSQLSISDAKSDEITSISMSVRQQKNNVDNSYAKHFDTIKQSLSRFNKKLSSDTDRKINSKITKINNLNFQLENIHKKINEYTRILRNEKYPTEISKIVTMSDIENLINQYQVGTQKQTKQIVTLSTVFVKIKILLEKQNTSLTNPSEKSFMFNL